MACDPFTGVMLPLEPNCHTTRGIRARTAPSSLQQCSDKTDISTKKAQFPLFHRPWSEVGTSARSGILRRFHGGFPLFRWSKSVPPRRNRASGRFETPGTPDRNLRHIGGAKCESRLLGRELPAMPRPGPCRNAIRSPSAARLHLQSVVGVFLLPCRRRTGAADLRGARHLRRTPRLRASRERRRAQ